MKHLLAFLLLGLSPPALCQWQSLGNLDRFTSDRPGEVLIRSGPALLSISVLADDLVRVRLAPSGTFEPDSSWAVVRRRWGDAGVELVDGPDTLTLRTPAIALKMAKRPLRLSFYRDTGAPINADDPARGMSWSGAQVRVWKTMPDDEFYYGFGEKAGRLQKKNTHMTMWNSDIPAYGPDTDPLYQTIPFFYGLRNGSAYAIFFDNSHWSSFDMGKEARDLYSFGAEGGELNYYFFAGPSPEEILRRYTELTGRMPLPPRWSLGYQQCRWSYPNETRVREIARGFRDRNIPCDVIYLDIDYMDGYRIFTWNRQGFPDPAGLVTALRKDGFRTAVIVDPGIKQDTAYDAYRTGLAGNHFLKYPDGRLFIGKVWPGQCAFPDFSRAETRTWWGDNFAALTRAGVRGWWNDMNEPSVFDVPTKTVDLGVVHHDDGRNTSHARNHNLYGLQMTKATYDGVRRLVPGERPFVLTRASYAGGHRYSSAWTGDNVASWEHLDMAIAMCLNLSISGQPFVGSDIGGFIGYPGGELFARWLQFGVFTPLMRAHSVINEKNKEPWEYGEEFTRINRETVNLRYTLLPYLYAAMQTAAATGIPPMRPLVFDYPDDPGVLWNDNDFMFGKDLLVAPVTQPGATTRSVRLPAGIWYDYWTGVRYSGGSEITVPAPIERIPLFVRAGAMIPTQQVVQYTDQAAIDPLTVTVYPADLQGWGYYYEDDGISDNHQRGEYFSRDLHQWRSDTVTTVTFSKAEGSYKPPDRSIILRCVGVDNKPSAVRLDGVALKDGGGRSVPAGRGEWAYDASRKELLVRIAESGAERRLRIER